MQAGYQDVLQQGTCFRRAVKSENEHALSPVGVGPRAVKHARVCAVEAEVGAEEEATRCTREDLGVASKTEQQESTKMNELNNAEHALSQLILRDSNGSLTWVYGSVHAAWGWGW